MARRALLSGRQVRAILEANGFVEVRRRGSHIVLRRQTPTGTITVPVPDHAELWRGTLAAIIRQSRGRSAYLRPATCAPRPAT